MKSVSTITLVLFMIQLLAPINSVFAESNPSAEGLQWRFYSDMSDGRRFLTDGSLILELRFLPNEPVPHKNIPAQNIQRLLDSSTDHEFDLEDLSQSGDHFLAPGPIKLNRKYIELLLKSPLRTSLRFKAKGSNDPVLILDGDKVVGVIMPMKT